MHGPRDTYRGGPIGSSPLQAPPPLHGQLQAGTATPAPVGWLRWPTVLGTNRERHSPTVRSRPTVSSPPPNSPPRHYPVPARPAASTFCAPCPEITPVCWRGAHPSPGGGVGRAGGHGWGALPAVAGPSADCRFTKSPSRWEWGGRGTPAAGRVHAAAGRWCFVPLPPSKNWARAKSLPTHPRACHACTVFFSPFACPCFSCVFGA